MKKQNKKNPIVGFYRLKLLARLGGMRILQLTNSVVVRI